MNTLVNVPSTGTVDTAPELTFWPGSLGARGFESVLEAASAGGFSAAAMSPLTLHELLASGHDPSALRARAAQSGVRLAYLDGAASWAPVRYGDGLPAPLKARFDFSPSQLLDIAEAAGMDAVLACAAFDAGEVAMDDLVESFAGFCDQAAARGVRVELEFVPFWGIPDLSAAWEVVRGADRPNGTLMVDTWHLLKASAEPEASLEVLSGLPADMVTGLQLADASRSRQADSLYAEGRFRRFPGDGELALLEVIRLLLGGGGLLSVGPEIFGAAIDDLTDQEAGVRAAATTGRVLEQSQR
ncbi:sugar phosphate isomerase/epimerase family protein [Streptomyces sp. enrichment culture]|uniref:sugar phosphate isomerase/epimerase family protein n=1 Tax=Streptomyces sp. enrichment culture TaxID=1795815 RepID=UPI003F54F751